MFENEINIYHNKKLELQSLNPAGGFVVIKDQSVLGVWDSRSDALKAGYETYGNVSFLVKDINESDMVTNFSRNLTFA